MKCKNCNWYMPFGNVGVCGLQQLPIKNYEPTFKCPLEREIPKIFKEEPKCQ